MNCYKCSSQSTEVSDVGKTDFCAKAACGESSN